MNFFGFLGNEPAKEIVAAQIDNERVSNAIIVEGLEGSGKKTFARIIAGGIVCSGKGQRPCGSCGNCVKSALNAHPDIKEIAGTNVSGAISVDQARGVRESAFIVPNEALHSVFILHNADLMRQEAANALLKILEEPPKHAVFILTAGSAGALLPTVLSRSVVLSLSGVREETAVREVLKRLPSASEENAQKAARICGGIIGQMLDLLQDGDFEEKVRLAGEISVLALEPNGFLLMERLGALEKDKQAFPKILDLLNKIYQEALLIKTGATVRPFAESSETVAKRLSKAQLLYLYDSVSTIKERIKYNANHALQLTTLCAMLLNWRKING